eukprot:5855930-Amphidinium_carterae.2
MTKASQVGRFNFQTTKPKFGGGVCWDLVNAELEKDSWFLCSAEFQEGSLRKVAPRLCLLLLNTITRKGINCNDDVLQSTVRKQSVGSLRLSAKSPTLAAVSVLVVAYVVEQFKAFHEC